MARAERAIDAGEGEVPMPGPNSLTHLSLLQIDESKTNPRRTVKDAGFAELVASVREHGVLQPILVRPKGSGNTFELVAGHRRFAAAREAGLLEIPAFVRELDDRQALEIQVIENLQRSDLHPLEEADGYRQLIEKHGYQVEQLADRVGKSKGYIYARLKLGALTKAAREPFLGGKIDASTALLVARMPAGLQDKAMKEILQGGFVEVVDEKSGRIQERREPMTYRAAAEHVRRNYMLRLSAAPFDAKDAKLVPAAGACGDCPKRTGNQPELFGDVRGDDLCTDPVCFSKKQAASWRRRAAEAKAAGRKVIDGADAKRVFPYSGNEVAYNSGFVDLDAGTWEAGERKTHRQRIGKALDPEKIVLARDPNGGVHELVRVADLPKPKKGEQSLREGIVGSLRAAQDRKAKIKKAVGRAMVAAVLEKAKGAKPEVLFPVIATTIFSSSWHEITAEVCKRRSIEINKYQRPEDALRKWLDAQPAKERLAVTRELVFECCITRGMPGSYDTRLAGDSLVAGARAVGVNLAAVAARARATETARLKPKKKAAPAKGAKAKRAAGGKKK